MVQWRSLPANAGAQVRSLAQEDSIDQLSPRSTTTGPVFQSPRATTTAPTCCDHGATTTEPVFQSSKTTTTEAHAPSTYARQREKPLQWEACASRPRTDAAHHNERKPKCSNKDPVQPKIKKIKSSFDTFCNSVVAKLLYNRDLLSLPQRSSLRVTWDAASQARSPKYSHRIKQNIP